MPCINPCRSFIYRDLAFFGAGSICDGDIQGFWRLVSFIGRSWREYFISEGKTVFGLRLPKKG